tara:strand:+ start:122 stop:385 length:264 start_codon:yes stop_codon:yes gene_type:complete
MGNCSGSNKKPKKTNLAGSLLGGLTGFLTLGLGTVNALKEESVKEYEKNAPKRKEKEEKYQEKLKAKRAKLYSKTPHVQDMKRELKF